jgi:hypothetical protein
MRPEAVSPPPRAGLVDPAAGKRVTKAALMKKVA